MELILKASSSMDYPLSRHRIELLAALGYSLCALLGLLALAGLIQPRSAAAQESPKYFGAPDSTATPTAGQGAAGLVTGGAKFVLPEVQLSPSLSRLRGVVVGPANFDSAKDLLIPELQPLVKSGGLYLDAVAKPLFAWRLDDSWEKSGEVRPAYALSDDGSLKLEDGSPVKITPGYPFGSSRVLEELATKYSKSSTAQGIVQETLASDGQSSNAETEKSASPSEQAGSEDGQSSARIGRELAYKVLWNSASVWWKYPFSRAQFTISEFPWSSAKKGEPPNAVELTGTITRVYPQLINVSDTTGQVFRESIALDAPIQLSDWRLITFRFLEDLEDLVWIRSPAIKKVRQLTGSNRGDPILRSEIAPNDLLGWSGKIEWVDAHFERIVVALTPFAYPDLIELKQEEFGSNQAPTAQEQPKPEASATQTPAPNATDLPTPSAAQQMVPPSEELRKVTCFELGSDALAQRGKWNRDSYKFAAASSWNPTQVVFAPRKLLRVELVPDDAHSLYGREVVYFESASMLPVYRIVHDRRGVPRRIIINPIGLATTAERIEKIPFMNLSVVFDLGSESVSVVDYLDVRWCTGLPPGESLTDFDPRRLAGVPLERATEPPKAQ